MYQYEKFKELNDFLGRTKLCCFSEDMDNILMWSHYANNYKGIVISLNTNMTYWGGDVNFKKVHYTSEAKNERIPIFNVKDHDINCRINSLITTKASFWSYEKEWRYIKYEVQNCPSFIGDNNKKIHCQKKDPQSISRITLGLNVLEEQVSQVLEIVRNNYEYKHVIVQQVKLDNIKYKFRFNALYSEYII